MPVYKDEERGTWYVRCYYEDFTGKKKQIKKRGFKLQREAKEWEADFLRKQKGSTDMTFRSMYEIYIEDMGTDADRAPSTERSMYLRSLFFLISRISPSIRLLPRTSEPGRTK